MSIARVGVVAVALLVAVGLCFAADAAKEMKAMGMVKSVDVAKSTVVLTEKVEGAEKDVTFVVAKEAKITEGDAAKTLADIKVGMHLNIEFTVAGEVKTANVIKIHVPKTEKSTK